VVEAVGTQELMMQSIRATRPGEHIGFVGVAHGVELPGLELFFSAVHLHGGPAPVRRFLPELIDRIWKREINPGKVFDLTLPLKEVAEGYQAMDEHRALKALLLPEVTTRTTPGDNPILLEGVSVGIDIVYRDQREQTRASGRAAAVAVNAREDARN
jgi:hypothetical protein